MFIRQVLEALVREKLPHAVVGGYALALHGIIRTTMDVDLVVKVNRKDLEALESALTRLGLVSRLPLRAKEVAEFRQEYIRDRNLFAWSFIDPLDQTRQVDLVILYDLKEIKTQTIRWNGLQITVADLPSLLKMKLAAGRPQDLLDVEKIREKIKTTSKT